jgi:hypothetical protein
MHEFSSISSLFVRYTKRPPCYAPAALTAQLSVSGRCGRKSAAKLAALLILV